MLVKLLNDRYVNLSMDNIEYIGLPFINGYNSRLEFNIRTRNNEHAIHQDFNSLLNKKEDYSYVNNKVELNKHFEKFKIYHKNLIDFINTQDVKYLEENEKLFKTINLKK